MIDRSHQNLTRKQTKTCVRWLLWMKETDKDCHREQTTDRLILPDRSCESQAAAYLKTWKHARVGHLDTTELESTAEKIHIQIFCQISLLRAECVPHSFQGQSWALPRKSSVSTDEITQACMCRNGKNMLTKINTQNTYRLSQLNSLSVNTDAWKSASAVLLPFSDLYNLLRTVFFFLLFTINMPEFVR